MGMPLNVGQVLSAQARLQPGRIGACDLERAMTFAEWNARACRLANGLLALGLRRGDRIAVLAFNRVEWAEIYVAAAKAGQLHVWDTWPPMSKSAADELKNARGDGVELFTWPINTLWAVQLRRFLPSWTG